jgi:RNase H-fold protein (predicted Holliday junction resolvase)
LILRHPGHQERAQELAVAYLIRDKLDIWLHDPRLKAELAEARVAESKRRRRGKPPAPPALARRVRKTDRDRE